MAQKEVVIVDEAAFTLLKNTNNDNIYALVDAGKVYTLCRLIHSAPGSPGGNKPVYGFSNAFKTSPGPTRCSRTYDKMEDAITEATKRGYKVHEFDDPEEYFDFCKRTYQKWTVTKK